MLKFFKKIIVSYEALSNEKTINAYTQQLRSLKEIWNDKTYGLERIFRIFLCLIHFIYPTLLVKNISGKFSSLARKLSVEFYIILKLFLPVFVIASGLYRYPVAIILIVYLLSETIFNILSLIFLSDVYPATLSYRRSLLFLFLNYIEVVLDFSIIYLGLDLLNEKLPALSVVYFSFVTNTTLGFGEYYPKPGLGQVVVIFQLIIFILFILLFINYFSSKINNKD
ncbi:MAG: two pore domain potassium channel family protein [Candidatus Omnitrophica bacterium]|nr:two pore domain potassium channel family protein [Candidatus Omnitrophota bacterium]